MNKLQRIMRKLRISILKYSRLFGDERPKAKAVKAYSKYNVHFYGRPELTASDARLDKSDAIFVGWGRQYHFIGVRAYS